MEYANICYRRDLEFFPDVKEEDAYPKQVMVTMEHNAFMIVLYMGGLKPDRILRAYTKISKDRAIETAVDIGKMPLEDVLKLPHIVVA